MPLPAVGGTLVLDIDPTAFPPGTQVNGTALTFANSGLTPVTGSPTFASSYFNNGAPAIKVVQSTQGFSVARPVQDDFTIYGVIGEAVGQNASASWFGNGPLIDAEASGVTNDFGLTMRGDGILTGGVGNPDTTGTGALRLSDGATHVYAIRRVKATGVYQVYVDGILDVSIIGQTGSLTASANLYFGLSASAGAAGGYYGRALAYNAAHSSADLSTMIAYLRTAYPEPGAALRSTKLLGYAIGALPASNVIASKLIGYATGGPQNDRLTATKFIAYGVLTADSRPRQRIKVRLVQRTGAIS